MSLPPLPLLLPGDKTQENIELIYNYLVDLIDSFPNAAGFVIDPSMGEGGSGALTITEAPTGITYEPGSSLSVDGVIFGHIDVAFTKPDRAVDIVIKFREQGTDNFKFSYASSSPERLVNLKVGIIYEIQMAGQAANGSLGPLSTLTEVEIPTDVLAADVPQNLQLVATYQSIVLTWTPPVGGGPTLEYEVQRAEDITFTTSPVSWEVDATKFVDDLGSIATTRYYRVRTIDRAGGFSSYTTPLQGITRSITGAQTNHTASRLIGTGSGYTSGNPVELTVDTNAFAIVSNELQNSPDTGWSTSGVTPDKALSVGDTLADTQHVLGTLIQTLIAKKELSA